MGGLTSYLAGKAAEEQVAQAYERKGYEILSRRWRGRGGEIDIVARKHGVVIFIEVKKSKTHRRAAENLSLRQIKRIWQSAEEYLCRFPSALCTPSRFDVALLDALGRIKVIPNAHMA